jgi:tetratricopeptide (TPR) repeat protein
MSKNILALTLLCSLLFLQPVVAQSSDLKTAHTLFMNGKYTEAVPLFDKAVKGPAKANPLAHYYYATCLSQLGKTVQANAEYRTALSLNPPAAIASYCHQALGTRPSGSSAGASTTSSTMSGGQNSNIRPSAGRPSAAAANHASIDPADKALLEVHRHTSDTDQIYNTVMASLAVIPKKIKEEIKGAGCKILICPTILEANPHLANTKAAGYVHGGGYDNCPGMFYSGTKILYIAEKVSWNSSPPQANWMAGSTTLHELGHAFDFVKGNLSEGGEFENLYKQDYGKTTNSQRTEWQYYCQENGGERGRAECFAELFAISHGTAAGIGKRTDGLVNIFPQCYNYIKQITQ